ARPEASRTSSSPSLPPPTITRCRRHPLSPEPPLPLKTARHSLGLAPDRARVRVTSDDELDPALAQPLPDSVCPSSNGDRPPLQPRLPQRLDESPHLPFERCISLLRARQVAGPGHRLEPQRRGVRRPCREVPHRALQGVSRPLHSIDVQA